MKTGKWLVAGAVLALIVAFVALDLSRFVSFEYLKGSQERLAAWRDASPMTFLGGYFVVYLAVTALSLPGAVILTLAGGALFGFVTGSVVVSFASSIGATLAFLVSRYVLRDSVEARFSDRLATINRNLEQDGAFYLFTLRLVPVFPFFLINLLMGLTRLRTPVFYLVSQIGMLPATLVFVNAGTQLAKIESPDDVLSPALLASFALLGLFPLITRKLIEVFKARQVYRGYRKPGRFERDIVVIGAGAGGLVSAYIGAAVKAKVTLIEEHAMGGDCLNTGCVPSKALIRSARAMHEIANADAHGIRNAGGELDFKATMARIHAVIARIEPHDSVERYTSLGVEVVQGHGVIRSPWEVEVDGRVITTRSIIIATGASPVVPPINGIDTVDYLTSENLWTLETLPQRLVVLGGGPVGCELTQAFRRLGSAVTQVEMAPRLLAREDPDVSALLAERFREEGVSVLLDTRATAVRREDGESVLLAEGPDGEVRVAFDEIIVAVGRKANTAGFGLDTLGIPLTANGTIETNDCLQTRFPNIHAVGDVAGPYQFTHTASHQAWYAVVNALFGTFRRFAADYHVIPRATFTAPEIARVGLNETEARERGIAVEVTRYGIDDLDRAIADGTAEGFVKVLTPPGKDRILGVTIVGDHAGDIIAEYVLAMKHGLGLNRILGTIHIYPTLAEANKFAAGEWRRANQPSWALTLLEKYHAWRRG
ncbi:MAG: pyridine nucleotide-disulfide oxidoreductase [Gammaproteobacteria bacterium]|nr:MAG: pyridine nucleotide-disulfide oxidoreductase [Gammaproteobacteria bacterium]